MNAESRSGHTSPPCSCDVRGLTPKLLVLTGGPGGGKTAVLELARKHFCRHVQVLPEAATMLFSGGFPRLLTESGRKSAQRAIFHVQRELETLALESGETSLVLCDRGTVDGAAYWPGEANGFFSDCGVTRSAELLRYATVLHLKVPPKESGYTSAPNPIRIETAAEAEAIDARILAAWDGHPRRYVIEHTANFLGKARYVLELIRNDVPGCCQRSVFGLDGE